MKILCRIFGHKLAPYYDVNYTWNEMTQEEERGPEYLYAYYCLRSRCEYFEPLAEHRENEEDEKVKCTRCETLVDENELITYGSWKLCDDCAGEM